MAYAATAYEAQRAVQEDFPYWKYQTMGDEAVRPAHQALDGLILPANHPFWQTHYPPWDWGCRCMVVPITVEEAARAPIRLVGEPVDPDYDWSRGWRLTHEQEDRLIQHEQLDFGDGHPVWVARSAKWTWTPGDLHLPLDEVLERYDEESQIGFRSVMRASGPIQSEGVTYRSVWDWLLEPARAEAAAIVRRYKDVEAAVAIDYDTGRRVGKVVTGTLNKVTVKPLLDEARRRGVLVCIEHNHPNQEMISPMDVALMLDNMDAVAQIGAHTGWFRYTVAPGEKLKPTKAKALVSTLSQFDADLTAGRKSISDWEKLLNRWARDYGWIYYELRPITPET